MSRLRISDPRSLENLMRSPVPARWVRHLEIEVGRGATDKNRLHLDLRSHIETDVEEVRTERGGSAQEPAA